MFLLTIREIRETDIEKLGNDLQCNKAGLLVGHLPWLISLDVGGDMIGGREYVGDASDQPIHVAEDEVHLPVKHVKHRTIH